MAIGLPRTEAPPREAEAPHRTRPRHPVITAVAVVLVVLLGAFIGWIALRAYQARRELYAALPAINGVIDGVRSGNTAGAATSAADLQKHASRAAELTGDPIWRLAEGIPWAGLNLAAVRTITVATDTVASRVVTPLVAVASDADPRSLRISGGRIDLAPLLAARPAVLRAQAAFQGARHSVVAIPTGSVIQPVGSAIARLRGLFAETAPTMDAVGNTARLLPGMLGASRPRHYLIVAQNPAELRATGGLIGSIALVSADRGAIALGAQAAGTSIGPWDAPVVDVPKATQGLYGPLVGRYLQDVNYTPDFPLAARTAAAMWERSHGGTVDGVITVDPVVLSALLGTTGPVVLPTGDVLTADNAVPLLLSQVYSRYPDPAQQDVFFASAAAAVFQRLADGGANSSLLVSALAASGSSGRLLIWSAHPGEERVLATTTLAGGLPVSTAERAGLGVYLDDSTGAKMDVYLGATVAAGAAICRADGTPTLVTQVTLANNAPADAGSTLPEYVTGAGQYGVPPGSIRTRIAFYGPAGGLLAGVTSGGAAYPAVSGTDRARPVAVAEVVLAPGESRTVSVEFLGVRQTTARYSVAVTPTLPGDGTTPVVGMPPAVSDIVVACAPR